MSAYHAAASNGGRAPPLNILHSLLSAADLTRIDQSSDVYRKVAATVDEAEQLRSQSAAALSAKSRRLSLDEWKRLLCQLADSPVRLLNELSKVRRVVASTEEWISNGARLVAHRADASSARHSVPFASIESHCHRMSSRSIAMLSAAESRDLIVLRGWSRVGKQIINECLQSLRTLRSPHTTAQNVHEGSTLRDRYRSERQIALSKLQIVAHLYDNDVATLTADDDAHDAAHDEAVSALLKRCQLDSLTDLADVLHLIALPIVGAVQQRLREIDEVRERGLGAVTGPMQTLRQLRQIVSELRRCGLSDLSDPLRSMSRRLDKSERWLADTRQFMPNGSGLMVESSGEANSNSTAKAVTLSVPQKRHATRRQPPTAQDEAMERAIAEQETVVGGDSGDDDVDNERAADEMPEERTQTDVVMVVEGGGVNVGVGDGDGGATSDEDDDMESESALVPLVHPAGHPRADIAELESLLTTYRHHSIGAASADENCRLDLVFLPEVALIEARLALCYAWQHDADRALSSLSSLPPVRIAELLQRADDIGVGMAQQKAIESATWKGKWIEAVTRVLNIIAATDEHSGDASAQGKTNVATLIDLLRQVKERYPAYQPHDTAADMDTDTATDIHDADEAFVAGHAVLLRSLESCLLASMQWTDSVRELFTQRLGAAVCDELFPPNKQTLAQLIALDTINADTLKPTKPARKVRQRRQRSRVADEADTNDDLTEAAVFCLCARPWLEDDDDVMIGCDVCRQWFHSSSCLHLSHHDMTKLANAQFTCPTCASQSAVAYAYRTRLPTNKTLSAAFHRRHQRGPELPQIQSLQISAQSLRCDTPQQTTLNTIAQRAIKWTNAAQQRLRTPSDSADGLIALESELEAAFAALESRISSAKIALTSAAIRSELDRLTVTLNSRNTRIRSTAKPKDAKTASATTHDYHQRLLGAADTASVVVHIAPSLNAQFPVRVTITCAASDDVPIIEASDGRLSKALDDIDVRSVMQYAAPSPLLSSAYSASQEHLLACQSANDADMALLRSSYAIPLTLTEREPLIARLKYHFAFERAEAILIQIIQTIHSTTDEQRDGGGDGEAELAPEKTSAVASGALPVPPIITKKRRADPKEISSVLSAIAQYQQEFGNVDPLSARQTQLRAVLDNVERSFNEWSARLKDVLANRESHSYETLYQLQARAHVRFAALNIAPQLQRLQQRVHSVESFLEKEVSALRSVKSSALIRKLLTQRAGECGLTFTPITQRLERECQRALQWENSVNAAVTDGASTEVFARLLAATTGANRVWADAKVTKTCKTMSELFCVCQKPYADGVPMIGCDTCNDWFHLPCVGLTTESAAKIESYKCPKCNPNQILPQQPLLPLLPIEQLNPSAAVGEASALRSAETKPKRKRHRSSKTAAASAATAVGSTTHPPNTQSSSKRARTRKDGNDARARPSSSVDSTAAAGADDRDAIKLAFAAATPMSASAAAAAYTINAAMQPMTHSLTAAQSQSDMRVASALIPQQNSAAAIQRSAQSQHAFTVATSPPSPSVSLSAYPHAHLPYQAPSSLAVATAAVLSASAPSLTASLFAVVLYQHLSAVVSPSQQVILYHLLRSYQMRTFDARCEAEMIEAVRLLCPDKINASIIQTVRNEYYDKTRRDGANGAA